MSSSSGKSYIDLSGGSVSHVEDHDLYINEGGATAQKLDVQFLQGLTRLMPLAKQMALAMCLLVDTGLKLTTHYG